MKPARAAAAVLVVSTLATAIWACVGDDPTGSPLPGDVDASTDSGGGTVTEEGGAANDAGADAGDVGPRCDPNKPFADVELLKGISTADDEHGVWVSADELTAYVAVTPAQGSSSTIKKSTRASRDADFSAPADDVELAEINSGGTTRRVPSLTADGLVLVFSRNDGVLVSVRANVASPFPTPDHAKARANPITTPGEAFIAPNGESLALARDNGVDGFEISDAPRDIAGIYDDAGSYFSYAPAPDVTNVNSPQQDRRPVYSSDRLTLVFESTRPPGSDSDSDMYIAQRAGTGGTFTSPARLANPINSPAFDRPGKISEDGCVLYFTSDRPGGFGGHDVYIAKRGK